MGRILTIAGAVLRDAIRRKFLWVVAVFAALMVLVIPSLPSYGSAGVLAAVYREVAIALMYVAAFVVTVAYATTRIPAEVERRTVFTLLARDVERWHYVVGTWLGLFAVVGIAVALFCTTVIGVGAFVYGQAMVQVLLAGLAIWFEMGVIAALAVLASTRFGVVTNVVAVLTFAFAGHSVSTLVTGGSSHGEGVPWYVPSLEVFNVINPVAHGDGFGFAYAGAMSVVFAAWVILLLAGASAVFGGRDL